MSGFMPNNFGPGVEGTTAGGGGGVSPGEPPPPAPELPPVESTDDPFLSGAPSGKV